MKVSSLFLVDAIGTAVVTACVGVGLWCGLLNAGSASQEIRELTAWVDQLDQTGSMLRAALQRQQDLHQQRRATFGARDLLPESTPVEHELRVVSDLARRHRLELTGFTPLPARRYPGVRELRYRMLLNGAFAGYLGFLRDFQSGASWADVTFLELRAAGGPGGEGQSGKLTISLYSATSEAAAQEATG